MKNRLAAIIFLALSLCPLAALPIQSTSSELQRAPFSPASTLPAGTTATADTRLPCTTAIPSSGFPGDCVVITFTHNPPIVPISGATVLLLDARGKTVARAAAFETATDISSALLTAGTTLSGSTLAQSKPETKGFPDIVPRKPMLVAVLALPLDLASGQYRLQTHYLAAGAIIATEKSFILKARAFPSEEITFNGKNTAIKQDFGPQRLAQIDLINVLLLRQDPTSPRFTGPFVLPVSSKRRTSAFAQSRTLHYSNGKSDTSTHYGIDFGVPTGTQVRAAGDGLVVMAESRNSTGWTIVIEHDPGIYSLYYHLNTLLVRKGAMVHSGDLIARSGSTGLATGPHLHWEFRVNGEAVSPDWFVGRKLY